MKKLLSIVLVLILVFSLCACGDIQGGDTSQKGENGSKPQSVSTITLLYSTSDSFNPYECITDQNRQITKLIFEPLVKVDNEFNAVLCLADDIKNEGNICTVTLKNVSFSDGSRLTADDVVYSFKAALSSKTVYSAKLYEVKTVSAIDSLTVKFELKKFDPYFKNVLDFPIFKSGSDKLTDEDSVKLVPIGCGKYVFNEDKTELLQNVNYYGKKGEVKKIRLINSPDSESVAHYVEIGATDIYFNDISNGEIFRMSGQKYAINLNNLIYIGMNYAVGDLADPLLRQAISSALNREKVCTNAYYNNAIPAKGFYNPVWEPVKAVQNIQTLPNSQITIENLEEIGYNKLDSEGIRYKNGRALKFTLLVNQENRLRVEAAEMIAAQLKEYGIKLTVVKVGYTEYLTRLRSGEFQLYLGEVNFAENMDISSLVVPGGSVAFGITKVEQELEEGEVAPLDASDIIDLFYKGQTEVTDVVAALQTEMPVVPVCYRTGLLFSKGYISNISPASQNDIFLNIDSYKLIK